MPRSGPGSTEAGQGRWRSVCVCVCMCVCGQVLTVIVDGHNKLTGARTHGCLHLIDLAGSERTDKSQVTGACTHKQRSDLVLPSSMADHWRTGGTGGAHHGTEVHA